MGVINPLHACTLRVTVLGLFVCIYTCTCMCVWCWRGCCSDIPRAFSTAELSKCPLKANNRLNTTWNTSRCKTASFFLLSLHLKIFCILPITCNLFLHFQGFAHLHVLCSSSLRLLIPNKEFLCMYGWWDLCPVCLAGLGVIYFVCLCYLFPFYFLHSWCAIHVFPYACTCTYICKVPGNPRYIPELPQWLSW